MLVATLSSKDGKKAVLIGLNREEMERVLKGDEPLMVHIRAEEMGLGANDPEHVFITGAETNEDLMKQVNESSERVLN